MHLRSYSTTLILLDSVMQTTKMLMKGHISVVSVELIKDKICKILAMANVLTIDTLVTLRVIGVTKSFL